VRFAINVPNFGAFGDPHLLVELAEEAEDAGWDGFFIWDHVQSFVPGQRVPMVDPWVALGTIAVATSRIKLGPMVTPIPRRRPWKLARECVTVDHLSEGRLILGVGLGDPVSTEFGTFSEQTDARIRADILDEGLAVLTGLWTGEPFTFEGNHFQVRDALCWPRPVQSPRIPIWVAGWWPNRRPMRRAARWDGVVTGKLDAQGFARLTPDEILEISAYIQAHRTSDAPFDIAIGGVTPADDPGAAVEVVTPYEAAGLTWWHECVPDFNAPLEPTLARIRQGPPKLPPSPTIINLA
jgi:alkanesulfonate monooxygenase SsuD/methylene tetrahydromethanopterin reductase-like flavin-dependent oxidoreductase (luciferase family)